VAAGCRLWLDATSLGGVESLVERRRKYAAESPTVPENLLRLSVGIEDVDDLWRDLVQALDAAGRGPREVSERSEELRGATTRPPT
jgi:cystathionine gamma-synthase